MRSLGRVLSTLVCAGALALGSGAPAQAAAPEPDYVLFPHLIPWSPPAPPPPILEDPCGVAVGFTGTIYVSNYYRHEVDTFTPVVSPAYKTPIENIDPLDGPCGLGQDAFGRIYINNYHRNVERYQPAGSGFGAPTVIDSAHPTGVAVLPGPDKVYVDDRTYVSAYNSTGAPIMNGLEPLRIGVGSLGDGYGLAVSRFPATEGFLYVPDHSDETVKVYNPNVDIDDPVLTIDGNEIPGGGFVSLLDSAIAVDRVTGEIYVADTLGTQFTERPKAIVYVFDHNGVYEGRLKYAVVDSSPVGLAVDNSTEPTQGRVYLTSGNTTEAGIYAYPPGSATTSAAPASFALTVQSSGSGGGSVTSDVGEVDCADTCDQQIRSAARVTLSASPDGDSLFAGWSGSGCSGVGGCTVTMDQAKSVSAEFEPKQKSDLLSAGPTAATSVIARKGNLQVTVDGKLSPHRLPRKGAAPISVSVGGQITTTDQSLPPQLKGIRIELNRNGRLDSTGLPVCAYHRIQPASSARAKSACRSSLVGQGSFTANITLSGQEPYPTEGRLLVFNGLRGGKPVLYGHIYSPRPFASSFVIVFSIDKRAKGTFGTALDAPLPKAMDAWGRLTGLRMTLSRRYSYKGVRHSFISAGCSAPAGFSAAVFSLARTEFSFVDGVKLTSTLSSDCQVR